MPYREVKTPAARQQVELSFPPRVAKPVGAYQCLVVSADRTRCEMLERAAAEGGWKTSTCCDVSAARNHATRCLVQLALVDLDGQALETFRPLIEQLTFQRGLLLVVCGNEGAVDEEIWVRQLGAWMYLPGVTQESNLSLLCGEARHIADRLVRANTPEHAAMGAVLRSGR